MKVLLICNYANEGHGIYTHIHNLCNEFLKQDELSFTVVSIEPTNDNHEFEVISIEKKSSIFADYFSHPRQILRIIEKIDPDIIHIHGTYPPLSILALKIKKYPLIITLHGIVGIESKCSLKSKLLLKNYIFSYFEKKAIIHADVLISISESISNYCINAGAKEKSIIVIPNAVTFPNITALVNYPLKHPCILFFGRLVKIKGIDILIKAISKLNKEGFKGHLYIAGEGPQCRKLHKLVFELGLSNNVSFLGNIIGDVKYSIIKSSDVCVFPSRYEAFGIVALEAMSMGKPVIVSNVGGLQSLVVDGYNGVIFPSEDINSLSECISSLIENSSLRIEMGNNGQRYAKNFSWDLVATKTINVYEKLMSTYE